MGSRIINGTVCILLILTMMFIDYPKEATSNLIMHGFLVIMILIFMLLY